MGGQRCESVSDSGFRCEQESGYAGQHKNHDHSWDARSAATTRLWTTSVEATFEADNAEDAAAVAERLAVRVLEHPQVWSVEGYFEDEQTPEVVDV